MLADFQAFANLFVRKLELLQKSYMQNTIVFPSFACAIFQGSIKERKGDTAEKKGGSHLSGCAVLLLRLQS
jgi:hypothetical protein